MSRPLRFQGSGLVYHVMARGNNKMRIFLDDLDFAHFQSIVNDVRQDYELDVWLYCVMPNHYHVVLRTQRANLSSAIRQVNGVYAQWWNKRHRHIGHVYQGRFKAQVVEACTYLVRLCRYVLLNPVRSGLAANPEEWRWSSYRALSGEAATGVDIDSLLAAIDPDCQLARTRLLEYVDGQLDEEIMSLVRNDHRVIGSAAFAKRFAAQARQGSGEVPRRERRTGTELAHILARALERGAGLHAGVIDAFKAHYSIREIAACAGLSPKVVGRLISVAGVLSDP